MAEIEADDKFHDEELAAFRRRMGESTRAVDANALFIPHAVTIRPLDVDHLEAMLAPALRKLLRAVRQDPSSIAHLAEASGRPAAELGKDVELLVSVGLMRMGELRDGDAITDRLVKKAHGKIVVETPEPDFDDPANGPFFAAKISAPGSEAARGAGDAAAAPPD